MPDFNARRIGLIQLCRKETMMEERSFFMGPSTVKEPASNPALASPCHFCILPSFVITSITDERPPPYRAGKFFLYRYIDFSDVLFTIERAPSKWVGLKMVLPSSRNTFWSGLPPRTSIP